MALLVLGAVFLVVAVVAVVLFALGVSMGYRRGWQQCRASHSLTDRRDQNRALDDVRRQ